MNKNSAVEGLPAHMEVAPSAQPLKIAVIYSRNPFPMMRGDQLTVSHFIAYFAGRGHKIDLFYTDVDGVQTAAQNAWLKSVCENISVYSQNAFSKITGVLKALLLLEPMQVGYFTNSKMKHAIDKGIATGKYDIVYCYYLRSASFVRGYAPNTPRLIGGRKSSAFLAMQLSQTLNTKRIFENSTAIIKKIVYYIEWKLMERYEARIWKKFTKTVLIGPKDVAAIKDACHNQAQSEINNWVYGAHGTDLKKFREATPEEVVDGRIVFSGSMLYQPNIQAVLWFVENCWGRIKKAAPHATLYIVGRNPTEDILRLAKEADVTVTGTVDDVSSYIRSAHVCINPMLAAGGMQNKLIEYLASGKAVVATSVANEGVMAPADALLIADDIDSFVSEVQKLLVSKDKAAELGSRARNYVQRNWSWEAHFEILESNFYSALEKK